ncbi:alpha/beta hydrolase [Gammaproteobacteria bacterium]|nr:alpha/beta hydrolase [Gammaproteobacteria bacterium]
MKKILKYLTLSFFILLVVAVYSGTYLDIPRDKLEAKYASGASKFLDLKNGSRIHYRDEGDLYKPAIILLHGFNGSLFNFERMVPLLSKEFRLISIDLPGFGLTGAVPSMDYSTQDSILVINELTSYLGMEKFSIAGNSMGGGIAWRYALENPEKTQSLVLLASSGIYSSEERLQIEESERESPLVWKLMRSNFVSYFLSLYTPKFFATQGLKTSVYDPNLATEEIANQFHELTLMQGSREAILSRFSKQNYNDEKPDILKKIQAPTLIIHGREDNIISFKSSINLDQYIQNSQLVIYPKIGHLPMYETPARVADDIKKFFLIED